MLNRFFLCVSLLWVSASALHAGGEGSVFVIEPGAFVNEPNIQHVSFKARLQAGLQAELKAQVDEAQSVCCRADETLFQHIKQRQALEAQKPELATNIDYMNKINNRRATLNIDIRHKKKRLERLKELQQHNQELQQHN